MRCFEGVTGQLTFSEMRRVVGSQKDHLKDSEDTFWMEIDDLMLKAEPRAENMVRAQMKAALPNKHDTQITMQQSVVDMDK